MSELRKRLPLSYAPKDLDDFGRYAAEVARHYLKTQPRPVTHFQILNEPLYTDYALPRRFGYTLADYLRLLETAERALHRVDPRCRVVGGISAGLDAALTRDFVAQGGLRLLDVLTSTCTIRPDPPNRLNSPSAPSKPSCAPTAGPSPSGLPNGAATPMTIRPACRRRSAMPP